MRAIIYTRTSTATQELSHAAQESACREYAQREGLEVSDVYSEQMSGGVDATRRPIFMNVLSALEAGDVLLVARRDRLGRSALGNSVAESVVKRKGARLVALDVASGDTPADVFMRQMIDAIAEYERALISLRTSSALDVRRKQGLSVGHAPLGKRANEAGELVENVSERETIKRVRALRKSGLTLREVRSACEREGLKARSGRVPSVATLSVWCKGVSVPTTLGARRGVKKGAEGARVHVAGLDATILELTERGWSQRAIVAELERRGYRTSAGKPYTKTHVWRVLRYNAA